MDNDDNETNDDTDDETRAAKATQQALAAITSAFGADMCWTVFARWQDVSGTEAKTLEHTEIMTFGQSFLEERAGQVSLYDVAVLRLLFNEISNVVAGNATVPVTSERIEAYAKALHEHGPDIMQPSKTLN